MAMRELAADEDKEVICAQVVLGFKSTHHLAKRFGSSFDPPAVVLFRDQQMYVFDKSFDAPDILDQLKVFVSGGYESTTALPVPSAKRATLDVNAFEKRSELSYSNLVWGAVLILVGICIHAWAIIKAKDDAKTKKATVASSTATASAPPAKAAGAASGDDVNDEDEPAKATRRRKHA